MFHGNELIAQIQCHQAYVTDRGSLIVSAYNATPADLASVGGPTDGWVLDSMFYEIDIKTQEILFSWSALNAGIPVNATKLTAEGSSQESPLDVSVYLESPIISWLTRIPYGFLVLPHKFGSARRNWIPRKQSQLLGHVHGRFKRGNSVGTGGLFLYHCTVYVLLTRAFRDLREAISAFHLMCLSYVLLPFIL